MPDLEEKIPEIRKTTRVKTSRGYHYYFSTQNECIKSTERLFGKNLELKGNGRYIVAPHSVIRNHRYIFEVPLARILPLPRVLQKMGPSVPNEEDGHHRKAVCFKMPKYHGHKMDCIRQILKIDLQEGERDNSLFVLYNLLLQNKNKKEYARRIVVNKNRSLAHPLTVKELKKIYRKTYHYSCSGIRDRLHYIQCAQCAYRFKGGQLSAGNILIKNLRKLTDLSNTQRSIACLLGTVFDGENPSISRIAKKANMDWRIVNQAINNLKRKGILPE